MHDRNRTALALVALATFCLYNLACHDPAPTQDEQPPVTLGASLIFLPVGAREDQPFYPQWTIVITGTGPCLSGEGQTSDPDDADKLGKALVVELLGAGHQVDMATCLKGSHHVLLEE